MRITGRLRWDMLWWLLAIAAAIVVALLAIMQPAEPAESDWSYFSHVGTGAAWNLADWDVHSIVFASAVTWREMINLDFGMIDFEVVEADGERWWSDVSPAIGISADVVKAIEMFPGLAPVVEWIPGWVGVGAGGYIDLEAEHDVQLMVYGVVKW